MAELLDLASGILPLAAPGEELEAYAVHRTSTTVQAGTGGVVRDVGKAETRGVGVRLLARSRMGYASTADLSRAGLADAVVRSRQNAAAADPDEAVALPTPEPVIAATQLWNEVLSQLPLEAKVGLATDIARRVTMIDPQIRSIDTAEYYDESVVTAVASTSGVRVEDRHGYVELSTDAIGESTDGSVADYSYWCGRDPGLIDIEWLAAEAVSRTIRLMCSSAKRLTGLPVVLDRAVVGSLLVAIGRACSGGPLSSGRSAFADLHGSLVGAASVNLMDDGRCPAAPAAALIDDEGVPRRSTTLIDDGVLVGALHTTTTARAIGGNARTTGNARRITHRSSPRAAPSALVLQPTCSLAQLLAAAGDATYLQQVTGSQSGISSVTGRVNAGAMGFRLRAGEPSGRLPTTAVATNLQAFLSSILMVADDILAVPGVPVLAATVLCAPGWLP
ncbi:metalloprotease TldD [soil metagenome]